MALFHGLLNRTANRVEPHLHRTGQGVAHGAWAVVELHGTADVDAARIDFHRGALHPVVKELAHAGQAARGFECGEKHLVLKTGVVLADHRHLQFVARAKVSEHAGLAHVHDLGQRTDGQTL